MVFLETLQLRKTPLLPSQSTLLGSTYGLTKSKNVELLARYYRIALKAKDESAYLPTAEVSDLKTELNTTILGDAMSFI